jgi:outer membrane protein assembly factor BamB
VRWRLTSVGISGLQFDEKGMIYASTTSASAENLKYSQQVDLSKRIESVIMKIASSNGKILWKVRRTGSDIYLSGKYLYTTEPVPAGGMRIYRLNPSNGEPLWEHYEKRSSEHCAFDGRTIQLLYNDELQVLRFLSL